VEPPAPVVETLAVEEGVGLGAEGCKPIEARNDAKADVGVDAGAAGEGEAGTKPGRFPPNAKTKSYTAALPSRNSFPTFATRVFWLAMATADSGVSLFGSLQALAVVTYIREFLYALATMPVDCASGLSGRSPESESPG
jgi:hypothetical protein